MPMSPRLLRPRASGGFDPRSISGLALWLDAADSASVTLNSGNVSEWRDKSGGGRHFSQSTAANQPQYVAGGQNNRSVLRNDGTRFMLRNLGGVFSESLSYLGETTHTIIFANKTTATNNANYLLWAHNPPNSNGNRLIVAGPWGSGTFTAGSYLVDSGNASTGRLNSSTNNGTAAHVFAFRRDGSAFSMFRNGTADGTATRASAPAMNFSGTFGLWAEIGLSGAGSNNHGGGDMYEAMYYNRALTESERQAIERYMGAKWGITVA
jgi:hypothetical protein